MPACLKLEYVAAIPIPKMLRAKKPGTIFSTVDPQVVELYNAPDVAAAVLTSVDIGPTSDTPIRIATNAPMSVAIMFLSSYVTPTQERLFKDCPTERFKYLKKLYMPMSNENDKIRTMIEFYMKNARQVHLTMKNKQFYNGRIMSPPPFELSPKEKNPTIVFRDKKFGELLIFTDEISRIEPIKEKEER